MDTAYKAANLAKPTKRQLQWQETEFNALISYGLPVFTSSQYGSGLTPAAVFWPEEIDVDSWCENVKAAGMKGLVLSCKHSDGFCLWPTALTDYSVKSSNWLDGEGDLVKMAAASCEKFGLKFGVSLSPWDLHEKTYGEGKAYDDYFCGLLTELCTNYGELFCVRLDGMIGADETRDQRFDWGRYYALIRSLQPDAVISFMGPDVRWYGLNGGITRNEEWSPVPAYLGISEKGESLPAPAKKALTLSSLDLGSRRAIKKETDFIWYPCEVSVPMRKHWFFDKEDKYSVKTKDKLLKLYYETVGGNASLLLGLAPNKRGVIDDMDSQILHSFGADLHDFFGADIVSACAKVSASSEAPGCAAENVGRDEGELFWRPQDGDRRPELTVAFEKDEYFDKIVLREHVENGQRVEAFTVFFLNDKGKWRPLCAGQTIGHKKIFALKPTKTKALKFVFSEFRDSFEISRVQIN